MLSTGFKGNASVCVQCCVFGRNRPSASSLSQAEKVLSLPIASASHGHGECMRSHTAVPLQKFSPWRSMAHCTGTGAQCWGNSSPYPLLWQTWSVMTFCSRRVVHIPCTSTPYRLASILLSRKYPGRTEPGSGYGGGQDLGCIHAQLKGSGPMSRFLVFNQAVDCTAGAAYQHWPYKIIQTARIFGVWNYDTSNEGQ